ncbi:dnaJ domain-containing protein [Phthorimaea operculella]|nr:dnaJ domain-containing protein [Phthorimaea operculella]
MSFARLFGYNVLKLPYVHARFLSCWSCGQNSPKLVSNLFCSNCNVLQRPPKDADYFKVLGVTPTFDLDENELAKRYKDLQKYLHPDKFANKNKEEQEISATYSTLVNEAYKTLLEPLARGIYMLRLRGKDLPEKTEVDQDFLMDIMEKNEEVENAKTEQEIMELNQENKIKIKELQKQVSQAFFDGDMKRVIRLLGFMKYYTSIDSQIQNVIRSKAEAIKDSTGAVISDSRSALEAICDPKPENPIAAEIHTRIHEIIEKGNSVILYWIKAHARIAGNERADEWAKQAALKSRTAQVYDDFPLSYAKGCIRADTLALWQERYTSSNTGSTTKMFFGDVRLAHKVLMKIGIKNIRTQLMSGHGGIRAYLYRFKLVDNPYCTCDGSKEETVRHILFECPKYGLKRHECECRMECALTEQNLQEIMAESKQRTHFLCFAEESFLNAAKANGSTMFK